MSTVASKNDFYYISIEGNIGCGKSVFIEKLMKNFLNEEKIFIMDEPIDEMKKCWPTLFSDYYNDFDNFFFKFQTSYANSFNKLINSRVEQNNPTVIISSRSSESCNNVFVQLNKNCKEFSVQVAHVPDLVVYLDCSVETCLKNIKKRNISEEQSIDSNYLERIELLYEQYLKTKAAAYKFKNDNEAFNFVNDIVFMKNIQ